MNKKGYGLVLEGGGAKGAYHIGVARALLELGLNIEGVSGTSIGALNGAMLVQGEFNRVYDLWYNIKPSQVYDVNDTRVKELKNLNISQENITYLLNKLRDIFNNRGIDLTILKGLLEKYIDEDKIRNSDKDFGMVTVSLSDMSPLELFIEDIPLGKLHDYLIASAYLPVFKMEKIDGKIFLDGGLYDNLPINMLAKKGYNEIIAVRTLGMGRNRDYDDNKLNVTHIIPSEDLGLTLDFSQEKARHNLKLGYYDTLRIWKNLFGTKYYIQVNEEEGYFINILLNLNEEDIIETARLFGYNFQNPRRILFEKIIPDIVTLLNLKKEADYKEIMIGIIEHLAVEAEIDRFNIYNVNEILREIKHNLDFQKEEFSTGLPSFMLKNRVLSKAVNNKGINQAIKTLFSNWILENY